MAALTPSSGKSPSAFTKSGSDATPVSRLANAFGIIIPKDLAADPKKSLDFINRELSNSKYVLPPKVNNRRGITNQMNALKASTTMPTEEKSATIAILRDLREELGGKSTAPKSPSAMDPSSATAKSSEKSSSDLAFSDREWAKFDVPFSRLADQLNISSKDRGGRDARDLLHVIVARLNDGHDLKTTDQKESLRAIRSALSITHKEDSFDGKDVQSVIDLLQPVATPPIVSRPPSVTPIIGLDVEASQSASTSVTPSADSLEKLLKSIDPSNAAQIYEQANRFDNPSLAAPLKTRALACVMRTMDLGEALKKIGEDHPISQAYIRSIGNSITGSKMTHLFQCTDTKDHEWVKKLVKAGASPFLPSPPNGRSPYERAVELKDQTALKYFDEVKDKFTADQADSKGVLPIQRAVTDALNAKDPNDEERDRYYHHIKTMLQLAKQGAWLDCRDSKSMTPLRHAVQAGDTRLCATLIALGANPNTARPLTDAVRIGNASLVEVLLKNGAHPSSAALLLEGAVGLHPPVKSDAKIAELLLDYSPDSKHVGPTLAKLLSGSGDPELIPILVNRLHPADPAGQQKEYLSLLQKASSSKAAKVVERQLNDDNSAQLQYGAAVEKRTSRKAIALAEEWNEKKEIPTSTDTNVLLEVSLASSLTDHKISHELSTQALLARIDLGNAKDMYEHALKLGRANPAAHALQTRALSCVMRTMTLEQTLETFGDDHPLSKDYLRIVGNSDDPNNSLALAAERQDEPVCTLLVKQGANPNIPHTPPSASPLSRAIQAGNLALVKLFLKNGGDPDLGNGYLLEMAVGLVKDCKANGEIVNLLFEYGSEKKHGERLLTKLALDGLQNTASITRLMTRLHLLSDIEQKRCEYLLEMAWGEQKAGAVEDLLKSVKNIAPILLIFELSRSRFSPLDSGVKFFTDAGAKLDELTPDGKTLAQVAAETGNYNAVKLLAKTGKLDTKNAKGETALQASAQNSSFKEARWLVRSGANPNTVIPPDGLPLFCLACDRNEGPLFEAIVSRKDFDRKTIHTPDAKGMLPLARAIRSGSVTMVSLLLELGAKEEALKKHAVPTSRTPEIQLINSLHDHLCKDLTERSKEALREKAFSKELTTKPFRQDLERYVSQLLASSPRFEVKWAYQCSLRAAILLLENIQERSHNIDRILDALRDAYGRML